MNALYSGLPNLNQIVVQYLTLLGLCSIRLLVVMIVFPPTSDSVIQGTTIRNGLAAIWSSVVAYGQQAVMPEMHGMFLVEVGLKEALIGLVIGYAASAVFWAAESAGTYIDDLTGYNNVQMTNPTDGQQATLTSTLLSQFAIAAFWLLGGMTFLLGTIYDSYRWWPLDSMTPVPSVVIESFVLHQSDSLMQTVAKLAAPVMMALLLVDIGFGLAAKVSQKLDVTTLSRPVKGMMTVFMLALLVGVFVDQVRDQLALTGLSAEARAMAPGTAKSGQTK
ncbi:EscT/YscT/HrcT family type III secretion system export apparatus protein [Burkholderia sp. WAC0059]|uniref:type III secretion system export apparatus subunit SctT n=1 Tax=Burkholderia sp. WAC0059 TaxID=2066022 RepID=UPI000C7F74DE|nr:type III secretion system export apparatus subunit SctT [Burkholderia sp. WAC0059]PLZ00298.1 EscT/YscT/HrcT family type III secretion system export apparatus protein [Burkholderia sp. WAC0059]